MTDPFDFSDLENPSDFAAPNPSKPVTKYPCGQCAGTGRRVGRHNHSVKCLVCRGQGYFTSSPKQRANARAATAKRKAKAVSEYILQHEDLIIGLAEVASWNSFACDMLTQLGIVAYDGAEVHAQNRIRDIKAGFSFKGKPLTPKQTAAAERMLAKIAAKKAQREAETETNKVEVFEGFEAILGMFAKATENGHKKPVYRAEGVVISKAPATGRNAGALYVKSDEGEYAGKIVDGVFMPTRAGQGLGPALEAINADPLDSAVRWGRKTGRCSCCGRELTNAESIAYGIGPICRDKWGL